MPFDSARAFAFLHRCRLEKKDRAEPMAVLMQARRNMAGTSSAKGNNGDGLVFVLWVNFSSRVSASSFVNSRIIS
ncbi:hypothetical protein CVV65_04065 [Kyrpidia spormannii]|uniref:Uncharacterized protein n=1 Tax=Kyrpidia spormannii TaxID=2055160 RepID=A0A2K8N470_9BACL|nr:hypothetical protein CVV65_04065 [Kyrpidia spormannii]